MERLLSVNGYEGYFVSDLGNVYSDKYKSRRRLSPRIASNGYYYVNLCKNGQYKSIRIHRIVAEAFLEHVIDKPIVNHIDGNKLNNRATNLEWVTLKENSFHASATGLSEIRGEANVRSKLTETEVIEMRRRRICENISYSKLGKIYNLSKTQTSHICRRLKWRHI